MKIRALFFFHGALKGMLILSGKVGDLIHFCLRNFIGENATDSDTLTVDMEHDRCRLLSVLVKEPIEDMNNELHRREIIIEK